MSRRVLIVEPDATGRAMMDRALGTDGFAPEPVASLAQAEPLLDAGRADVAIVDTRATAGDPLEDIRAVRRRHPRVPVIATGASLSARLLLELLRLGVADALPKPFTPVELRAAVRRALAKAAAEHHPEASEYAAAMAAAREAIVAGRPDEAAPALARAHMSAPLDAEATALCALVAELSGKDADADRGYRAALALQEGEDIAPPDPHEALARLDIYGGARPVAALSPAWAGAPAWIVTDAAELKGPVPCGAAPLVILSLGLPTAGAGAVFFRERLQSTSGAARGQAALLPAPRAFALLSGAMRPETLAPVLAALGGGPLVAAGSTRTRLDLDRLVALRDAAYPAPQQGTP